MDSNILYIASNYPPRIGGPATTVPQLATEASKENNLTIIAFREKEKYIDKTKNFSIKRSPSCYWPSFSNPFAVFARTIFMSIYSRIVCNSIKPRIIHAHDSHISAIAALFCKLTSLSTPTVIIKYAGDLAVEFSGLKSNNGKSIEDLMKKKRLFEKILFRMQKIIFNASDYIHVQNEYQKKVLKKLYSISDKKIFILPNPLDTSIFKYKNKTKKEKKIILTVSRLVPWKGIETMIKAMPNIITKNQKAELHVYGEGSQEYTKKLLLLTKELGINDKVYFFGKIEHDKLPAVYYTCDVFVQPSKYEPFGISVIEAASCGKPLIASRTGGLVEIVKGINNGYLFESENEKELAKKVNLVLKKRSVQKKSKKTEEFLKQFSLYEIGKRLNDFYKQV